MPRRSREWHKKCEEIKNDAQLLEVVRYIHNNPIKAEIVQRVEDYSWSSFRYYINKNGSTKEFEYFLND